MITVLNGAQLLDMFRGAKQNLLLHKTIVDELNVFPVPDGDTGTNMVYTASILSPDTSNSINSPVLILRSWIKP